jgi:hypothetical protein
MSNYIVGLVSQWGVPLDPDEWYGINIIACDTLDPNRIAIADGWDPHDHGSALSAAEILPRRWYRQSMKDGRFVFELEPPGWFERRCAVLKCSWFHPFVQRMAGGERVSFEQIKEAYRLHNNGRLIPTGTWMQLREGCLRGSASDDAA